MWSFGWGLVSILSPEIGNKPLVVFRVRTASLFVRLEHRLRAMCISAFHRLLANCFEWWVQRLLSRLKELKNLTAPGPQPRNSASPVGPSE